MTPTLFNRFSHGEAHTTQAGSEARDTSVFRDGSRDHRYLVR
jgi:hypothetical protein